MTRRSALAIVAALLTRGQAQSLPKGSPCRLPETLQLDLGAGACAIKTITVKSGVYVARVPVADLMAALGSTVGDDGLG